MSAWTKTIHGTFCKNITDLRHELKWSREYLAQRMGISAVSVTNIESGITNVTLSRIKQMAAIYDIPLVELLKKHDEELRRNADPVRLAELKGRLTIHEKTVSDLQHKVIELYEELKREKVPAK